jgi:NADH-quinone oxidoreductase subunit M
LLEVMVLGVFCALDLVLFYLFFEAVLMPMYIIIGIWGGELRVYAAYKFFLYTLLGSILFLLAIIYIYVKFAHFDISLLGMQLPELELNTQKLLWLAFFASFAVKIPMWPFHTWLPYAHVQAPTAGSVILAGILIKIGAFGFIKFSLPMLPQASVYFAPMIYVLSAIAIIYASLVALVQEDMKKLIAYSSVAHMGIVTIGIFSFNGEGIVGAMVQMISHGIISSALFLGVGVLYDRTHTKSIASYGGVANVMPKFAFCLMIITMASIGLPGTSGFMGEFMALVGIYATSKISCLIACFGMILGAYYMLLLYKKVMLGKAESDLVLKLKDIDFLEMSIFLSLIGLILLIGIYPKVLTDIFVADIFSLVEDLKLRK